MSASIQENNHNDNSKRANPYFSPMDAMIALDFGRWRVPATESIAGTLVEEARARQRPKDKRGRIQRSLS